MPPDIEDCIAKLGSLTGSNMDGPESSLWQSTLEHVVTSLHRYKPSDAEALVSARHVVDKLDEVSIASHESNSVQRLYHARL
jgi:hypothetical protein